MNLRGLFNPSGFISAVVAMLLCGCWLTSRPNTDDPANPKADVVVAGVTGSVPVSVISGGIASILTGFGVTASVATGVGAFVPVAFGLWALWYRAKVRQLRCGRPRQYRLGKLQKLIDKRTLKLTAAFDDVIPPPPEKYNFDEQHPELGPRMFLNDSLGCCVIASRGHATQRLEHVESNSVLGIEDAEIRAEYFKETGGVDEGLVMLLSLQAWRKGWTIGGREYRIEAFGMLQPKNHYAVKAAIYLLGGVMAGVELPASAEGQLGGVWDVVSRFRPSSARGSWGGHAIWVIGYNEIGPVCITWGKYQQMTWAFFDRYFSEVYGVIDSINDWTTEPGFDADKLKEYLNALRKAA